MEAGVNRRGVCVDTPASQTLIALSAEPETIVLPSGEKATELMPWLWVLSLLALSSSVAATHAEKASALWGLG